MNIFFCSKFKESFIYLLKVSKVILWRLSISQSSSSDFAHLLLLSLVPSCLCNIQVWTLWGGQSKTVSVLSADAYVFVFSPWSDGTFLIKLLPTAGGQLGILVKPPNSLDFFWSLNRTLSFSIVPDVPLEWPRWCQSMTLCQSWFCKSCNVQPNGAQTKLV